MRKVFLTAGGNPGMAPAIACTVVFAPDWWRRHYGIAFDAAFYFDRDTRIRNDVQMRRALYERFEIGEPDPQPRPVIGSLHVAGGFVVPALLGVEIRFAENQAPWPVCAKLSLDAVRRLRVPDIETTWPFQQLIADMDALERDFGCVVGDFNPGGILNTALDVRGNDLFIDMIEEPETAAHLFGVVAETERRVAQYTAARTGSSSIAVNRSILNVQRDLFLHSNCAVSMISPALYEKRLLGYEAELGRSFGCYGIHHCGGNLHSFARVYASLPLAFVDVGWGSDVARCSQAFPGAFLNLRLNPVRLAQASAGEVAGDAARLLAAANRGNNVGLCCINIGGETPDQNVVAALRAAARFTPCK